MQTMSESSTVVLYVANGIMVLATTGALVLLRQHLVDLRELRAQITRLIERVPEMYVSKHDHARAAGNTSRWVEVVEQKVDSLTSQVAALKAAARR